MKKLYCDCCGQDITEVASGRIYRLLLDVDAFSEPNVVDFPDVCPDCAREIKARILEINKQKRGVAQ